MTQETPHYVYVMATDGACKVGVSNDVAKRAHSIKTSNPRPVTVHYSMKCRNARAAYKIEKAAHKILASCREEGEWFACDTNRAVMAVSEAALEFAATDYKYVDMPRGGEMALSSKAARYLRQACSLYGLRPSDVVDEAIVEYFGSVIDRRRKADEKRDKLAKFEEKRSNDNEFESLVKVLRIAPKPLSKLRKVKAIGRMDDRQFEFLIDRMTSDGIIRVIDRGRGRLVELVDQSAGRAA